MSAPADTSATEPRSPADYFRPEKAALRSSVKTGTLFAICAVGSTALLVLVSRLSGLCECNAGKDTREELGS